MTIDPTIKVVLGFDFGKKRIGVAIGQTITKSARPLTTIKNKIAENNWDDITKIINQWLPDALIVGVPLNMDGTEQAITHDARKFAAYLKENFQIAVYEIDERLTSKDARERLFKEGGYKALQDGQVDSVAAQLIIQNWFAENS